MKRLVKNQQGVTLVETVVAMAIIAILVTTVMGALLYGQQIVVFTDSKNNAAAIAQKQIDLMMTNISAGTIPATGTITVDEHTVDLVVTEVDKDNDASHVMEGYDLEVEVFYNNGESSVVLEAYVKKGGLGV